ncbi:MAG TPA: hypothetical protein VGD67_19205 [Pseudonocardiaceae bacterium]
MFVADGAIFSTRCGGPPDDRAGPAPYDQGSPSTPAAVACLSWVAFGDIAFIEANTSDTTIEDLVVVLSVWCC